MDSLIEGLKTWLAANMSPWDIFGLVGQTMFMMRFIVQWVSSERAKKVVVPEAFWYLSAAGGAMVLIYAIHLQKIVFILGQFALPIYLRNIYMIWKNKKAAHA